MSTLWTPDGERPVSPSGADGPAEGTGPDPDAGFEPETELTPEQQEQARMMAKELAEARARLLEADAGTVVANHALGIYELAAIHLTADEPKLSQAKLAVDALAALVEGLEGRLGESEAVLTDALHQARMAFVQRSTEQGEST
jgi:hypothetical protein